MKIMRIFNFFLKISIFLTSVKTIQSSFDDTLEDFLISQDFRDQTFDNNRDNNYFSQQYFPKINNQFNEKFERNYPNIYGKNNNRKIAEKDISVRIEKKLKKSKAKDKKQFNINTFFDLLFGQSMDSLHIRKRIKCGPEPPFSGPLYEMPNQERGESLTLEEMNDRANRAKKCRLKKLRRLIRKRLLTPPSTTTAPVVQVPHIERTKCFTWDQFVRQCTTMTPQKPIENVENLEKTTEKPTEVDVCLEVNAQFRVKCPTMGSMGDGTHTNAECGKLEKLHRICFPKQALEVRSGIQSVCEQIMILNQKCSEMTDEAKRNTIECENIDVLHAKCFKQSTETCDKLRQIYKNCLNGTHEIMIKSIECETIEQKFNKCLNVSELTEGQEKTTTIDPLLKTKCISKKCLNKKFGDEKVEEHSFEAPDDYDYPELNVTLNPLIECKALETEIQSLGFNEKNFLKGFAKSLEQLNETHSGSEDLIRQLRRLEEKGKRNSLQRRELFKNFMNFCQKCENSSKCETTTTTPEMESGDALEQMISESVTETTTTETTTPTTDAMGAGMEAETETTTETTTMQILDDLLTTDAVMNEVTSYEPTVQETTPTEETTTTDSMEAGHYETETTAQTVVTTDDDKDEEDGVSIVNYNVLGMSANDKNANNVDKYLRKANPLAVKSINKETDKEFVKTVTETVSQEKTEMVSTEETTESTEGLSSETEKTLTEMTATVVKQTESEMNSEKGIESEVKESETEDTLSTDESESEHPEEGETELIGGDLVSEVIQTII